MELVIKKYSKNEELICVLPCCYNENKKTFFSYSGATYGGPAFLKKYYNVKYLSTILNKIFDYYSNNIEFRIANNIYFKESSFLLQYLLGKKLNVYHELSWYIDTNEDFLTNIKNKGNKQKLKQLIKNNVICNITNNENDYIEYHKILSQMLLENHNTQPTHSLKEFLKLKTILNTDQELYICKENENIYAGVYVIKTTKQCWYTVYMCKNTNYLDTTKYLIYINYVISLNAKKNGVKYLDYGICTENKGTNINEGLATFKENSLGGISNYRYLFLK
jgi:uncharacterized protein YozE (UPF0346 family)